MFLSFQLKLSKFWLFVQKFVAKSYKKGKSLDKYYNMNGVYKKTQICHKTVVHLQRLSSEPDNCHTSDSLMGAGEGPEGMPVNRQHLKTKV